jgi:ribosomal protein S12 methylthiotransferase accessory factor
MDRKPLVAETSSGTAAQSCRAAALLSALCELIERDSLMMFWHRQPPTRILPLGSSVMAAGAADLESIRQMGFVVTVCNLQYDLGVPCVLVVALRGDRYACGSGCHPSVSRALEQALRELGISLRWQVIKHGRPRATPLAEVRTPPDHSALYDGGPFHRLLRAALDNTIRTSSAEIDNCDEGTMTDEEALDIVIRSLGNRGYRIHEFDLTPGNLNLRGLTVRRAFVPGLIPLYFGLNNLRLGCRRLWGGESPGRFCTLMPHFIT